MLLDAVLVGAVALGALAGWRRGFVLPLATVAATVMGFGFLSGGGLGDGLPAGTTGLALMAGVGAMLGGVVMRAGGSVVSLVHRVPLLRAGDRTLGAPLGAGAALVGAYVALAGLLSVDAFLAPLHGKPSIDAAAIAIMRETLAAQPQLRLVADPAMLDELAAAIAQNALPRDRLAEYDRTLAFYEETVRPAVISSSLGPVLIRVGELLPVVGRHVDYPRE